MSLLTDTAALLAYLQGHLREEPLHDVIEAPQPTARPAAVLAPLYSRKGRPHLLFTQRTASLRAHSGEISFPGGARDAEDASLLHTALRESEEELAIASDGVAVLGALPAVFSVVSNYLVMPYVGYLGEGLPALVPNPAEVAVVIDAPLAELADPAIFHEEVWMRGGIARTIYFYDLAPYRIWGLTGRIVHSLLALLPPPSLV